MRTDHDNNDDERLETDDWISALDAAARHAGPDRARRLLGALERHAKESGLLDELPTYLPYRNTIALEQQSPHPGDVELEERITSIIRWNALAMVVRANRAHGELGGHIASYASAAEIFEMGFNHFFNAASGGGRGDLIYFQPHSSPGVYARAFLEGRLQETNLAHYRQEITGPGLCSYPHPWLMPDFWQFPTGSMGIGVINSVYQARFLRYLKDRGLSDGTDRRVWGVFGDGEMDEPESLGGLALAAREGLDNLTFIVNCNLQRLDGPVRGNGQIIPELESMFRGFGWNVIRVLWGSEWDPLFARDKNNALLRRFADTVDGKYQTLGAKGGAYNLANFFSEDPDTRALVAHMSEQDIDRLKRGGHDFRKLYAAFKTATETKGRPTVILAKTKKGYGMGGAGESRMTSHQAKKLDLEGLLAFRDRFSLPLTDTQVENLDFYRPAEGSREIEYIKSRRSALGGFLPARRREAPALSIPPIRDYAGFALDSAGKESSTTVAAVRVLSGLLKDKLVGPRIVPIVADEARTFGMANLFRQIGIYSPVGQLYEPEDAGSMLFYKESKTGQLLEEGINEAGALSSWTAAATSYSVSGEPMLPFYIYYSMFGFQRVGDLIWAAADQRARGFLIGATAGRTTLGGEGLQHQDGSSHLIASTIPNCRSYDPAYAYEIAVILDYGARRMLEHQADEFFYITAMNESYAQPSMPEGIEEDIVRGMYRLSGDGNGRLRLLGSGAILPEVIAAANVLRGHGITLDVYSVTSFGELAKDAREVQRETLIRCGQPPRQSHVGRLLAGDRPIIAATDYVRAYPQLIAPYVSAPYVALGTDGFGRSDTRSALRAFFEVDQAHIVLACLSTLAQRGEIDSKTLELAMAQLDIAPAAAAPWLR